MKGFTNCCSSTALDETDCDMLWNGNEEDGDIRSECEEDDGTVEMETGTLIGKGTYKACPSESRTEVGAPLFPAVELCDFSGRWQCMSGEI